MAPGYTVYLMFATDPERSEGLHRLTPDSNLKGFDFDWTSYSLL